MLLTSCVRFSLSVVHRKSPSVLVSLFTTDDAFHRAHDKRRSDQRTFL